MAAGPLDARRFFPNPIRNRNSRPGAVPQKRSIGRAFTSTFFLLINDSEKQERGRLPATAASEAAPHRRTLRSPPAGARQERRGWDRGTDRVAPDSAPTPRPLHPARQAAGGTQGHTRVRMCWGCQGFPRATGQPRGRALPTRPGDPLLAPGRRGCLGPGVGRSLSPPPHPQRAFRCWPSVLPGAEVGALRQAVRGQATSQDSGQGALGCLFLSVSVDCGPRPGGVSGGPCRQPWPVALL